MRTIVNRFTQLPGVITSEGEAVIAPSQLSVAVKSIGAGTSVAHCAFTFAGGTGATGGVVSSTLIV